MIVKDEAAMLGPCLESVKELMDEIIIVDTGSTDETVALSEKFGAKVIRHQWQNDFALARNLSLEQATGDWILFLDADERMDRPSLPLLKEITSRPDTVEGYRLQFINYVGDGSSSIQGPLLRLFRNRGHRFTGKIHEQIEPQIAARGLIQNTSIIVHHFGYLRKIQVEKNKGDRNISMLQAELRAVPQDPYLRFQLGRSLGIEGRHAEAVQEFDRVYAHYKNQDFRTWPFYAVHALYLMSKSYYLLGRYPQALQWSQWAIEHWEINELYYQHGLNQQGMRRHADAIAGFQNCLLGKTDNRFALETVAGMGSFLPMLQIGKIYEFCGDEETAHNWYGKAFEKEPNHAETVYRLVRLTVNPEMLLSFLRSIKTQNALEAFCFGCAETGYESTPALLDRLEKKCITRGTRNARLRYLGRHGDREELIRLLKNDPDEYARFMEFLIFLNERDGPAARKKIESLQHYRIQADAAQMAVDGRPGPMEAFLVVPLCIDFSLKYLFDSVLAVLPEDRQDEALMKAQKAWKGKWDPTETKSSCGVACDLRTAMALREHDLKQAGIWLEKAGAHGSTITRYLHRLEWQCLAGETEDYKATLEAALKEFPGSLLLRKTAEHFVPS